MNDKKNITVVYLAWLPYGIEHFKTFITSYLKHPASWPHQLVLIFNGLAKDHPDKPDEYLAYLENAGIPAPLCYYFDVGQDIESYKKTAAQLNAELILFFNTYSKLLADNWLEHYADNFSEKTGVIGAYGSFQSYYSSVFQKHAAGWEPAKGFLYNFRKYKLFIKAFFYWRFLFRPFPCVSLRTNAFMVRREDFLMISNQAVDTKFKAYQFESGRKSMTAYFQQKGLEVLVVDKNGKTYKPDQWKSSLTFWIGTQENLLVEDNQTRIYDNATTAEKKEMTWLAWGQT